MGRGLSGTRLEMSLPGRDPSFVNIPKQAQPAVPLLGQREGNLSPKARKACKEQGRPTLQPLAAKHPILKQGREEKEQQPKNLR